MSGSAPPRNRSNNRYSGPTPLDPLSTLDVAGGEHDLLETLVPSPAAELGVAERRSMPIALQRRVLHRWLREQGVSDVSYELVENVRALIEPDAAVAKVNLPGGKHARRRSRRLFVE